MERSESRLFQSSVINFKFFEELLHTAGGRKRALLFFQSHIHFSFFYFYGVGPDPVVVAGEAVAGQQ